MEAQIQTFWAKVCENLILWHNLLKRYCMFAHIQIIRFHTFASLDSFTYTSHCVLFSGNMFFTLCSYSLKVLLLSKCMIQSALCFALGYKLEPLWERERKNASRSKDEPKILKTQRSTVLSVHVPNINKNELTLKLTNVVHFLFWLATSTSCNFSLSLEE